MSARVHQNVLLLALVLPGYVAATLGVGRPLGLLDLLATTLFMLFLCGETTADQQQYEFQGEWGTGGCIARAQRRAMLSSLPMCLFTVNAVSTMRHPCATGPHPRLHAAPAVAWLLPRCTALLDA